MGEGDQQDDRHREREEEVPHRPREKPRGIRITRAAIGRAQRREQRGGKARRDDKQAGDALVGGGVVGDGRNPRDRSEDEPFEVREYRAHHVRHGDPASVPE